MITKLHVLKTLRIIRYIIGSIVAGGFVLLPFYIIFFLGVSRGFHLGALIWSFFVLCMPFGITSSIINLPFWFALGRSFAYAEIVSWAIAIALNAYTYATSPILYFKFATTYMLYRFISHPWPYWLIIASCAAAMLFRTFGRLTIRQHSFIKFHMINLALIIITFTLLTKLAYHELVIILNIQA